VIDPDESTARAVREALDGVGVVVETVASLEEAAATLSSVRGGCRGRGERPPRALLKAL
jgi:hypothetical protein